MEISLFEAIHQTIIKQGFWSKGITNRTNNAENEICTQGPRSINQNLETSR